MNDYDRTAEYLDARIQSFMAAGSPFAAEFDRLALDLFSHQYDRNEPYRRYCDRLGRTPREARSWLDVPAIPIAAFADVRLACFAPERTALVFESSGTTRAGARSSRHELDRAFLYEASLLSHFRACVMPDVPSLRMLAFAPPFDAAPRSSLAYMLSAISAKLGTPDDRFFIRGGELDVDAAAAALDSTGEPVLLIGTAFAFVHFIDHCRASGKRFRLPGGSRLVETGGFKGRSRTVERNELYQAFRDVFGLPRDMCLSEYGMCELGSQWYDVSLLDRFSGRPPRYDAKIGPHWAKAIVVDPVTARPLGPARTGLLQFFDLSNRGSVASILSADLGREIDGGIELLGRFSGAPPKGCSIAVDAMLSSVDG